jgi:hypothetical protein
MTRAPLDEIRWWTPLALVGLCVWAGAVLGFATNAVNGRVSPEYFQAVMRWPREDVPAFAVVQGMFEGGALGLLFGLVFAIAVAASSRLRCPVPLAAGVVWRTVLLALACWAAGGAAGVAVAAVAGDWLGLVLAPVPPDSGHMLGYGWVGGSIWGGYAAAAIGAVYGAVSLHRRWHRHWAETTPAFPVLPLEGGG